MRRLSRVGVAAPADWDDKVKGALPDKEQYDEKAAEFESLPINDRMRREGFRKYAPQVLPLRSGKHDFPTVWNAVRRIKTILRAMSAKKCAYCEQNLNARRLIQVEHFQPKSLFPSLCYEMDNYFAACGGCNGEKGDRWPQTGGYVRPDRGRPERRFVFAEDGSVRAAAPGGDAQRTIEHFGLDRPELQDARRFSIAFVLADIRALLSR